MERHAENDRGLLRELIGDGVPLFGLTAAALLVSGGFAVFLAFRREFLPHDVAFLGMDARALCAIADCRVVRFMFHDRVAFGGTLIAVATLYSWLAAFALRQRFVWAWRAFLVSGVLGFGSFLAYLGYGYLDSWHGVATLVLLPIYVAGLVVSRPLGVRHVEGWLRSADGRSAPPSVRLGRWLLLATGASLVLAGAVIIYLGMTEVFVAEDLGFMGVTRRMLDDVNLRLVPLIAHDRAGFGGGLASTGVLLLICAWYAAPSRAFHQAVVIAGTAGFGCAIGTHFVEGYVNPLHLAPAFAGAGLFAVGALLEIGGWRGSARVRSRHVVALLVCALPLIVAAQTSPAAQAARAWRQQHERAIIDEFVGLLSIPNIASDRANIERNAKAIAAMMEKRGIAARLVSAPDGNPVVVGEIRTPGATRTVGFYAHYDGQPLDPKEWVTPPFEPTLRDNRIEAGGRVIALPPAGARVDPEWRLYARGAADDKAPILAMLTALDAIRAAGISLKANVKFAFEGEEEAGSTNLEATLAANKSLFAADLWLMCDGPVYQTRQQSVVFGARGVTRVNITVYGPRVELHSGHYGNWAPNPAMSLARLLASMKDDTGRVLVDHFYDDVEPLGPVEKRALRDAPPIDRMLMDELWLASTDGRPSTLNELITTPSLNIRGMASSRIGAQASNIIPASAEVTIDIRMVKGMDPRKTGQRVVDHIRRQGYFVVDREPTADERRSHAKVAKVVLGPLGVGSRTPMDLPISQEVVRVVESARGRVVTLPTMGGGLPLQEVERPLGTRTIVIPMGNHDNNQHSANENLRIQNLWDGIELMAALLTM